jgi:hypothetical protein
MTTALLPFHQGDSMAELQQIPKFKARPEHVVKVDLDDRAFLFPAGKSIAQIAFATEGRAIHLEAIYPFNETRTPPRLLTLALEDAKEFARRLIDAVYQARTQLAVSDGMRISVNVIANGYHIQIGDMSDPTDLYLSTGCIWRVCQGLLRAIDHIAPVESN